MQQTREMLLEIVCPTLSAVKNAIQGGAQRIELCADLSCGGITPSSGLVEQTLEIAEIPVVILLRIREGDFVFSAEEKNAMLKDVRHLKELGVDGIVSGGLLPNKDIDLPFVHDLIAACGDTPFIFHRAFDVCNHPLESAAALQEAGTQRILTAGQAPSAKEGLTMLRQLVSQADRPQILAGGGIRLTEIDPLLEIGVDEIHSAAMVRVEGEDSKGFFDPAYSSVDPKVVAQMRAKIDQSLTGSE